MTLWAIVVKHPVGYWTWARRLGMWETRELAVSVAREEFLFNTWDGAPVTWGLVSLSMEPAEVSSERSEATP